MKASVSCIAKLKEFEGLKLTPYLCKAGKPTIGYGCRFYKDGTEVKLTDKSITVAEANELFDFVVDGFARDISCLIKIPLKQNQFDALVMLVFNIGVRNFARSTILKLINARKLKAASEEFKRWIFIGSTRCEALLGRRLDEAKLFIA